MIINKQKLISEQAIYGDLQGVLKSNEQVSINFIFGIDVGIMGNMLQGLKIDADEIKPILRPLSDLTKEITHQNYNNNQPFIPLEMLESEVYKQTNGAIDCSCELVCYYGDLEPNWSIYDVYNACSAFAIPIVIDLLNQLHFDTRQLIDLGEAIDANSLPINPYEVNLTKICNNCDDGVRLENEEIIAFPKLYNNTINTKQTYTKQEVLLLIDEFHTECTTHIMKTGKFFDRSEWIRQNII